MEFKKLTPNLIVEDVSTSLKFYQEVLGFKQELNVPEQPPYVFASVASGNVEIFLNQREVTGVHAQLGGTCTMYLEVEGLDEIHQRVQKHEARIVMQVQEMFYGMREFSFLDPDGYTIIIAERISK